MGVFDNFVNGVSVVVSSGSKDNGVQDSKFDIKQSRVESMIREINDIHDRYIYQSQLLRLIFDYEKLNKYGKTIVKEAGLKLTCVSEYLGLTKSLLGKNDNEVAAMRKSVTKMWVDFCRTKVGIADNPDGFYFILYALLVVSVDETDKEKNLSIICDFARMLMITDEEVKDIIEMIKIIYNRSDSEILSQHYHKEAYGTKAYDELFEMQCKEFDKYIKSNRTIKMFKGFFEKYVGINEENLLEYRQTGLFVRTWWGY